MQNRHSNSREVDADKGVIIVLDPPIQVASAKVPFKNSEWTITETTHVLQQALVAMLIATDKVTETHSEATGLPRDLRIMEG